MIPSIIPETPISAKDVVVHQPGAWYYWLVYFRLLHTCKNYHINVKYMMNTVKTLIYDINVLGARVAQWFR